MDPISEGLLAALAGGAGGELGEQVWASLGALIKRPFRRTGAEAGEGEPSSGEAELVALEEAPSDPARELMLRRVLAERATADPGFRNDLEEWLSAARQVRIAEGAVSNSITGGTFSGAVVQGRDFSSITFSAPPAPAPPQDEARGTPTSGTNPGPS
ncbi:hypothetical protein GCM10009716_17940 [Streptomyces sodiiphilus]|uniref:Uncharacterized protein n=1 Tax=Streptomyces sodiiphilus TaxID=226217 RepID=A0ABP5AB30_9ACTN